MEDMATMIARQCLYAFTCGVCEATRILCSYQSHRHLKERIRDIICYVTPDIHHCLWNEVEYCLDVCRATKGSYLTDTQTCGLHEQ